MVQWDSLWRSVLVVATAAAALVVTGHASAAGGSPAPVPDDPPAGLELVESAPARTRPAAPSTRSTATPPATSIPTPDDPLVESAPAVPVAKTVVRPRTTTWAPTPARVTTRARVAVAPTVSGVAERRQGARAATPVGTAKRAAAPTKEARRVVVPPAPAPRRTAPEEPLPRVPHDTIRVPLPVGTFEVVRPDAGTNGVLLVAAAFLLGVAATGTAVVGIAARGIARHA